MKNIKSPFLFVLFLLIVISACKDDDAKTSKTDLLTARAWHNSKVELTFNGVTEDVTEEFSEGSCDTDDSSHFLKDGKYEEKVGTNKCSTDDVDMTGTWAWADSETKLIINIDGETLEGELMELTASQLKVKLEDEDFPDGASLIFTFTGK